MRILHLIDADSPQATPTTLAMLGDALGRLGAIEQRVYLLGGSSLELAACAAGIGDFVRVGVPMGRAVLGWRALRRELRRQGEGDFDLVHGWSIGALTLATMLFRATPRLLTLTVPPTARGTRWLRVVTGEFAGRAALLPISSAIRRTLLMGGVNPQAAHVVRPAIDMSRVMPAGRARAMLRQRWKIDDPRAVVVGLAGDPPTAADAVATTIVSRYAMETLLVEGIDVRAVMHPSQRRRLQAKGMLRALGGLRMLIDEPDTAEPWNILPGCDIVLALGTQGPVRVSNLDAIVTSSQRPDTQDIGHGYLGAGGSAEAGGGGLSLLWAMASNVPIVGEATYGISEIVEDRHSALLAKPGLFRGLAHRIRQIITDKQLAWQLRDTARHECYSFFSRARYCDTIRAVYEQMAAGQPIEVPAMEVTGGLRFAGRA